MLGAELIVDFFCARGAAFYTFPGGTIAPLYDALLQRGVNVMVARHEQGAGYAALAQSRLKQQPQVVMVTSGPGVTNIVTVAADAFFDATPLIILTGQIGTSDLLNGRPVRQRGFQEVDTPRLVESVCKHCYQVTKVDELPAVLSEAYTLALAGRRGPVVIDLPMDVQRANSDEIAFLPASDFSKSVHTVPPALFLQATNAIKLAQKPLILAGQGILQADAITELRSFARMHNIPVAQTLLGLGALAGDDPLHMGFVGHTGMQIAGKVMQEADCVLVLGARLDVRQTGTCVNDFCRAARSIIHVDMDEGELLNPRVRTDIKIHADVKTFLALLQTSLPLPDAATSQARQVWLAKTLQWKATDTIDEHKELSPRTVVHFLDTITRDQELVVTTGVGSHQHWAARHFTFDWPKRVLLTSGGHGAMGYDLPSAVGAALTYPNRTVYCVVGDASLQMNIQELQVIRERNMNIKIIVLDNNRMALVSQFQRLTWGADPTTGRVVNPDFAAIAGAYDINAATVNVPQELEALKDVLLDNEPFLMHCRITPEADVLPMLLGGEKLDAMHGGTLL